MSGVGAPGWIAVTMLFVGLVRTGRYVMATEHYTPTERRPIAARGWPIWQRAAVWLARRGVW